MTINQQGIVNSLVAAITLVAAIWLGVTCLTIARDPSKNAVFRQDSFVHPDQFNTRLDQIQKLFTPIDKILLPGVSFRYICQEQDEYKLDYIQAVIAPRRIGPDVTTEYLFVMPGPKAWVEHHPELKNATLVTRMSRLGDLYRSREP